MKGSELSFIIAKTPLVSTRPASKPADCSREGTRKELIFPGAWKAPGLNEQYPQRPKQYVQVQPEGTAAYISLIQSQFAW